MESRDFSRREFVTEAPGPSGLFGVFEDDGETGYLYLYEPGGREMFRHLRQNGVEGLGIRSRTQPLS